MVSIMLLLNYYLVSYQNNSCDNAAFVLYIVYYEIIMF